MSEGYEVPTELPGSTGYNGISVNKGSLPVQIIDIEVILEIDIYCIRNMLSLPVGLVVLVVQTNLQSTTLVSRIFDMTLCGNSINQSIHQEAVSGQTTVCSPCSLRA